MQKNPRHIVAKFHYYSERKQVRSRSFESECAGALKSGSTDTEKCKRCQETIDERNEKGKK